METFFLIATFVTELYICWILTVEFFYDKKVYESKRRRVKRTKNKVVIQVENGQATISEQPKDVEVVVENK
jgi:hypothetical protein